MKKKTIVIDMDDVITVDHYLGIINEYTGKNYKSEDFKDYYMQDVLENKKEFFEYFKTKNLYNYGHISKNAISVIKELTEKYEVFIGSSFIVRDIISDSGIFVKHKYDFLMKNFPFIDPMNYVFLGNKSVLNTDIMIDDKESNLKCGKMKLLFTAYHNKNLSNDYLKNKGITRVNSWDDIKKILLEGSES